MSLFADLGDLTEDDRIRSIGTTAMNGHSVGIVIEKKEFAKIARYIRKVAERYPDIMCLERINGPGQSLVTLRFGRRVN